MSNRENLIEFLENHGLQNITDARNKRKGKLEYSTSKKTRARSFTVYFDYINIKIIYGCSLTHLCTESQYMKNEKKYNDILLEMIDIILNTNIKRYDEFFDNCLRKYTR